MLYYDNFDKKTIAIFAHTPRNNLLEVFGAYTKETNFDCCILFLLKQGLLIDFINVKHFLVFTTETQSWLLNRILV